MGVPATHGVNLVAAASGNGVVVEDDVFNGSTGKTTPQILRFNSAGTPTADAWMTTTSSGTAFLQAHQWLRVCLVSPRFRVLSKLISAAWRTRRDIAMYAINGIDALQGMEVPEKR